MLSRHVCICPTILHITDTATFYPVVTCEVASNAGAFLPSSTLLKMSATTYSENADIPYTYVSSSTLHVHIEIVVLTS